MARRRILGLLLAASWSSALAFAQSNPCQTTQPVSTLGSAPVPQAAIVYDPGQKVCWLANANLASDPNVLASLGVAGIDPNGAMDFDGALRLIAGMNAFNNGAGWLGHNNWQLPVTAMTDKTCLDVGTFGGSFGPGCTGSAMGNLYSTGLAQSFPSSVAPAFGAAIGPIHSLKASYYWAEQNNGGTSGTSNGGQETFSFANGIQGGNTINDTYFYTLPMVAGAIGTAPACPAGGVVPYTSGPASGLAVYDCTTGYTWPADANLAASNSFGIAGTVTITNTRGTVVVAKISGGAMLFPTATQWIQGMNAAHFSGSSAWQMPATSKTLQDLFNDLNLTAGDQRIMWTGTIGPFEKLQPFIYWACQRDPSGSAQSPCSAYAPPDGSAQLQWTYNFDYGFQPTSSINQKFFVLPYYPAAAQPGPLISLTANAEGEALTIAPNTWVEVRGSGLAPAGDTRIWRASDFVNGLMPTALDGVSVTVNGISAYVLYISPEQINILTPVDTLPAYPQIVVTNNGASSAPFPALGQALAPSFFVFSDGQHVAAVHADGSLVGPASLSVPGYPFTPALPGETISVYANGFGPTSEAVVSGSPDQGGTLDPLPVVTIGGKNAAVTFAGLRTAGLFQFNVTVPDPVPDGDRIILATYGGASTQPGTLLTVHH